jgi:hypothetical protein
MNSARTAIVLAFLGLCWSSSIAFADQPLSRPLIDRNDLPAALQGLTLQPDEIVTAEQAAQIRGNWIMTLNLPYFATRIEGQGRFHLNLWTISGGANAGTPMFIRIVIP